MLLRSQILETPGIAGAIAGWFDDGIRGERPIESKMKWRIFRHGDFDRGIQGGQFKSDRNGQRDMR